MSYRIIAFGGYYLDKINTARLALSSLTVYRGLLSDKTIVKYVRLLETTHGVDLRGFLDAYGDFFYRLSMQNAESFNDFLTQRVRYDDNLFTRQAAAGKAEAELCNAAQNDIRLLKMAMLTSNEIKNEATDNFGEESEDFISHLPEWKSGDELPYSENDVSGLAEYYINNGCGIFAQYGALKWHKGKLRGVENPDPVRICDLKGYEYEHGVVIDNTLQFLDGCSANNILLYGDRGTGKSSTVKAVSNEYRNRGLRIIGVPKDSIADLTGIIETIAEIPLHFIIFIDDLSFQSDDDNYTALKAVLEGGLASRPKNTVIYATSNRRHFVKENFSEREGDDVHAADAVQEKLSLADRFGITVTFSSPDQNLYLDIVKRLAADRKMNADIEALERGAKQWALMYNGRSPRTAKQFVDWAEARFKSGRCLII